MGEIKSRKGNGASVKRSIGAWGKAGEKSHGRILPKGYWVPVGE
jgi:hypothetical protein